MIGKHKTFDVREATEDDAIYFSTRMRKQDLMEVEADTSALESLLYGVESSNSYVLEKDGEPILMMGGGEYSAGLSCLWMVATPSVRKIRRELVKNGRDFALWLMGDADVGGNVVWAGNHNAIRWLKKIGASFHKSYDVDGEEFIPFHISR